MKSFLSTRPFRLLSLLVVGLGVTAIAFWYGADAIIDDWSDERPVASPPADVREFAGPIVKASDYRLSGPYTHANLTVLLVHGADQFADDGLLTLQEALEQKKAIVHETGNVNELSVENRSADEEIYVQSGDIVKGGQQDRTLHYDLVVAPRSGKVPLASYCVEQGRWSQRGHEKVSSFGFSGYCLSSKEIKLANYAGDQGMVWDKVAAAQGKLTANLECSVQAPESSSSLALTLENSKVTDAVQPYLENLAPIVEEHDDAIGYVFAVNGQLNSAEIYGSSRLFRQSWPKLLRASAVEAVGEKQGDKKSSPIAEEMVRTWLHDAEIGKAYLRPVGDRMEAIQQEGAKCLLFESRDRQRPGTWLRRTYLAK